MKMIIYISFTFDNPPGLLKVKDIYNHFHKITGCWPSGYNVRQWPGRLKKMLLDASLLNTQHYKVRIKGKVE